MFYNFNTKGVEKMKKSLRKLMAVLLGTSIMMSVPAHAAATSYNKLISKSFTYVCKGDRSSNLCANISYTDSYQTTQKHAIQATIKYKKNGAQIICSYGAAVYLDGGYAQARYTTTIKQGTDCYLYLKIPATVTAWDDDIVKGKFIA